MRSPVSFTFTLESINFWEASQPPITALRCFSHNPLSFRATSSQSSMVHFIDVEGERFRGPANGRPSVLNVASRLDTISVGFYMESFFWRLLTQNAFAVLLICMQARSELSGPLDEHGIVMERLSSFQCSRGHYRPFNTCFFDRVVLDEEGKLFVNTAQDIPTKHEGGSVFELWGIGAVNQLPDIPICEVHDIPSFVFTIHFDGRACNYYHLHYDNLLPLFALLENNDALETNILMPTVENSWAGLPNGIIWDSVAFRDDENNDKAPVYMEALQVMSPLSAVKPLASPLLQPGKCLMLDRVTFGLPRINHSNRGLVDRFVAHIRTQLSLATDPVLPSPPRAAFVSRRGRRRIVNEQELVDKLNTSGIIEVDMIDFEGMSFRDQVATMQGYSMLIGMQGAGMTNGLYLPQGAVVVVLLQYGIVEDPFHELLANRGPYLQWLNRVAENSFVENPDKDPFGDSANTYVPWSEFEGLIHRAVRHFPRSAATSSTSTGGEAGSRGS